MRDSSGLRNHNHNEIQGLGFGSLGNKESSSEYLLPKRNTDARMLYPSGEFFCELSLLKKCTWRESNGKRD